MRKTQMKKKSTTGATSCMALDSSLTSIEWLPKIQIGENSSASPTGNSLPPPLSTTTTAAHSTRQSLPTTNYIPPKIEAVEMEIPNSTVHDGGGPVKPPFSYVTLIRQAILSTKLQRMTLNEIYQWITDTYPYFQTAAPKWKNSIRHNLSLNKCFKRLARNTNDPGKGSYWAVDESSDNQNQNQIHTRKRKLEEIQPSPHFYPTSPATLMHPPSDFYTNNNPMICGDMSSVGGQSSSTDESDSTVSFIPNPTLMLTDDFNLDLTASFRRFREQVLDAPSAIWGDPSSSYINPNTTGWPTDVFPPGETNSFFESIRLASSGEIDWNEIDVKPYCEFLDGFRTNSTFQQQDRDKLIGLASSLSSFFDHAGITNLAQSRIAGDSSTANRLPPNLSNRTVNHSNPIPIEMEEEHVFDWDSLAQ